MLNVKKLLTKILVYLATMFNLASSFQITSATLIRCTGTVNLNSLNMYVTNGGLINICGRVAITNFVRSGNNPGIYFTLPSSIPTPNSDFAYACGFRAESPRESLTIAFSANSRTVYITTNETYLNAENGTLTFMINSILPWG